MCRYNLECKEFEVKVNKERVEVVLICRQCGKRKTTFIYAKEGEAVAR